MEPVLSNHVQSIPASGIRRIFELASRPGIISLSIGEPDFDTPVHIRSAAKEALDRGETRYAPNLGILELRQAVARKMARFNDLPVDPEREVIITVGGTQGLYLAMAAVLNPDDAVLLPDPGFVVYANQTLALGCRPIAYPLRVENGFHPDMAEIEKLVTPETRVLILNSPGNPTGQLFSKEILLQFAALAERHDLIVISDEVYETIVYDGRRTVSFATLPGMRERTITINSLSKSYAMTGWRLGYTIAHRTLIEGMMRLQQIVAAAAPTMLQRAAALALDSDQSFCSEMAADYQERRDLTVDMLNRVPGFRCIKPEGAFYAFPDVRGTGMSSGELCEFLVNEARVGCVPGIAFGAAGEGFIRISYATSRDLLEEAGRRMARALSR